MKTLKLNRKVMNNQQVVADSSKETLSVTNTQLERFTPVLLKVAKKLVKR